MKRVKRVMKLIEKDSILWHNICVIGFLCFMVSCAMRLIRTICEWATLQKTFAQVSPILGDIGTELGIFALMLYVMFLAKKEHFSFYNNLKITGIISILFAGYMKIVEGYNFNLGFLYTWGASTAAILLGVCWLSRELKRDWHDLNPLAKMEDE